MALSRNFRTTYYKTLGVPVVQHIVDVDASFAALLDGDREADDAPGVSVNVPQLVKLALEVGVAPAHRALAWQLLAGALPPTRAAWAFAREQRCEMFDDLLAAAEVLRPGTGSDEDEEDEHDGNNADCDAARLVKLHRVYWTRIRGRSSAESIDGGSARAVAKAVCEVLAGDAERFWCLARVLELLGDGLELLDPPLSMASLRDTGTVEIEGVLLRVLDVKRRRAAESTSSMHKERYG